MFKFKSADAGGDVVYVGGVTCARSRDLAVGLIVSGGAC